MDKKTKHWDICQNIFFYDPQKKECHTILERHEGEQMITIFIFGLTIPLSVLKILTKKSNPSSNTG